MASKSIYAEAANRYGMSSQLRQTQEELAELSVAISHFERGRTDETPVLEELGDVYVMLCQCAELFGKKRFFSACVASTEKLRDTLKGVRHG